MMAVAGSPAFVARRPLRKPRKLAGAPDAVHARHDHGATWPVFLHVVCDAIPHRIRSWVVVRIDTFLELAFATRIDRYTPQRPSSPARRGGSLSRGRCLSDSDTGGYGLRLGSRCRQKENARKCDPNCRRPDSYHEAHPNRCDPTVSDCRRNVNCAQAPKPSCICA